MEETTPRRDCGLITGPWAYGGAPLAGGRGMATRRPNLRAVVPSSAPLASFIRTWQPEGERPEGTRNLRSGGRNTIFEAVQKSYSLPVYRRGYAIHTLLSSTYLSHGVMRPRGQRLWGRVAPPSSQLIFAPHRGDPEARGAVGLAIARPLKQAIMEIAAEAPLGCPFPAR